MKIRSKLSLLFTFLTAAILLVFAATVYFSASRSRENEFYKSLKKEAITKANLYFTAKVNPATLQAIYKNNRETIITSPLAWFFGLIICRTAIKRFCRENPGQGGLLA